MSRNRGGFSLNSIWEEICNLVIRPQRCKYDPSVMLGPKLFMLGNRIYERKDIIVTNKRKEKLQCSHYMPIESQRPSKKLPCVVYLHGNCGSRCDALDSVQALLPHNITVFAFDFSGSGLSDGKFVSLGHFEKDDVEAVLAYLEKEKRTSKIGLWGRSMGAATALVCSNFLGDKISGIVCDSPFTTLEDVIIDLIKSHQAWVPKKLIRVGIGMLQKSIQKKAKFNIKQNTPIKDAQRCCSKVKNDQGKPPALIGAAYGDNFIHISHSEKLYEVYSGEKDIVRFDGDHNSERPDEFYEAVSIFFYNVLVSNDTTLEFTDPSSSSQKEKKAKFELSNGKRNDEDGSNKIMELSSNSVKHKNNQILIPNSLSEENFFDEIQMQKVLIESVKEKLDKTNDEEETKELKNRLKELEDEYNKKLANNFFKM